MRVGELLGIKDGGIFRWRAISATRTHAQDAREFELGPFESVEYKYALAAGQARLFAAGTNPQRCAERSGL